MNRWRGKVAVITGASSGIGEDIARRLVEEGLQVVGIARNVELVAENSTKLTNQSGGKLHALKCDVTSEDQVAEAFKWVKDNLGPVHILINNAGLVKENFFCDGDPKVWKQVLDTNLYGVALCSHAAVKQMREADVAGHIVNINSIAGHKVVNMTPNDYNMYAPSKHGVTAFTEVLRQELIHFKTKIKVSSISPGLVQNTNIFNAGNFSRFNSDTVEDSPHLLPEDVSDGVLYILGTKPNVQVHELTLKPVGEPFFIALNKFYLLLNSYHNHFYIYGFMSTFPFLVESSSKYSVSRYHCTF